MTNRFLPLMAAALLVAGVFAVPAIAQDDDGADDGRGNGRPDSERPGRPDGSGPGNAERREYCSPENVADNETRREQCERVRSQGGPDGEHGRQAREFRDRCLAGEPTDEDASDNVTSDPADNVTDNSTQDDDVAGNETGDADDAEDADGRRCDRIREAHEGGNMARREAHAILHAIAAHQRRYERLNETEVDLEARLAEGNLTENETLRAEHRLERIDNHQNRTQERIDHLQAVLARLQARWEEVRDHVEERHARNEARREARDGDDSDDAEDADAAEGAEDAEAGDSDDAAAGDDAADGADGSDEDAEAESDEESDESDEGSEESDEEAEEEDPVTA